MAKVPVISSHILHGMPAFLRHEIGERALLQANRAAGFDLELTEGRNCFIPHAAVVGSGQPALFEDLFQCPVLFNAPAVTIVMERHHLLAAPRRASWPIVTIEDVARDRRGGAPQDLLDVVVEQIRAQVITGSVSIDSAAKSMDTSVRTLQRELNRAGTDFRSMASAARLQRATELLRHTNGSITRVSAEMGYSSPANFARAFRKAAGRGPREFRSKM
jgi:AraC-like DNA-binding protein